MRDLYRFLYHFYSQSLYFSIFLITACSSPPLIPTAHPPLSQWVSFGPNSVRIVRAIVSLEEVCPAVTIDGHEFALHARAGSSNSKFPVKVCEKEFKANFAPKDWSILGHPLPAINESPKKILVIGDTGCQTKMKNGKFHSQNCNDPLTWPFEKIAQAAAAWKPDLVIHVGDYHYRETSCPLDDSHCAGTFAGDAWESWNQDFFSPGRTLLRAAPFIFVRGNHELCARGGLGWFRFLDPRAATGLAGPLGSECVDQTDPYEVSFKTVNFAVIDSAEDQNILPSLLKSESFPAQQKFYLTHRPFLTEKAGGETTPGLMSALISGHQHHANLNQFSDGRPPEIISGNGGTELETFKIDADSLFESKSFGFLTLENLKPQNWILVFHDQNGNSLKQCQIITGIKKLTRLQCEK